ncbi:MAG TPA: hypothetical protein VE779_00690, partial [Candidatus Angelobacter sp.]|nr:hypothetical protein [Candidatus Angelobacter sp.]
MDAPDANALFASSITRGGSVPAAANAINTLDNQVSDLYSQVTLASPVYTDQVLPFDITLSGANEYGAMCAAKILGVEILNEVGLSVLGHHISLARGPERRRQMEDGRLFPDGFSSSAVSWPPRCRRCRRRHLSRCCWDAPNRCSGFTGRGLDGLSL